MLVDKEVHIETLKLIFSGNSVTKTTRPSHTSGNTNDGTRRQEFEEKIRLFNREKEFFSNLTLGPKKHSWPFEFRFPQLTEQHFKRLTHGANYLREPHVLPPSFHLKTSVPGGTAQISYFVQAKVVISGSKDTKRCKHVLRYHPRSDIDEPRDANVMSTVLYGQQWKPAKEKNDPKSPTSKALSLRLSNKSPRIVPCFSYTESIAPGQHIPLSICLRNTRDPTNKARRECILDSLHVTISTFSTVMCGHSLTLPEDVVSKHVSCIARTNINQRLPFNEMKRLTSNFRLIDDNECVPTFKTYTITRRYAMNVSIGIKYGSQQFTIRSSTPLEILPRISRDNLPLSSEEIHEVEPLPLYRPREPSKEFAPDYESIYALSPMPSSSTSNSLSLVDSRSSSVYSAGSGSGSGSGHGTAASTPASEIEQPSLECGLMQADWDSGYPM